MSKEIMTVERFKKEVGVHVTTRMNGKMEGMQSLNTSCMCNKFCQAYAKDPNKICSKCYAIRQMKMYKNMEECFRKNHNILTLRVLKKSELPLINACYFRFNAFGELDNETQLINYFNICKANKYVNFSIWSKNLFIIDSAIKKGYNKPKNLIIIASSPYINDVVDVSKYSFVDKVFTVYDKDYIKEHDININCGSKNCLSCQKCYNRKDKDFYINEKLK